MFALKRVVLTILALSSTAGFSGTMGPVCTPGNVTIPCEGSAWSFGAQALYLQPTYSTGAFIQTTRFTYAPGGTVPTSSQLTYKPMDRLWGWGFKLDGTYYFKSGNDLNLNWYHLDHSNNEKLINETSAVGSITDVISENAFTNNINVNLKTQWDAVNLELGQHVDFATWKNIRFHGGFQYATIQTTNKDATISPLNPLRSHLLTTLNTMKYYGVGPRVGADLLYGWNNGFSIYANGATALLIGKRKFNNSAFSLADPSTALPSGSTASVISTASETILVPELEAKAGLSYAHAMGQGHFIIDAGWMWANYFNAQAFTGPGPETVANFGIQGPYAGLKWIGNLA